MTPIGSPCPIGGGLAGAACSLTGGAGGPLPNAGNALTSVVLNAVVASVVDSAKFVLHASAQVLSETTAPQLTSTWFSSTYWRVAGIAAILTLPFLFAAAVQGLVSSDLGVVIRAALGYLPLASLAVVIAAPLTMLLLAASDQMSAIVSSAAGNQSAGFLVRSTGALGTVAASFSSPFVLFLVGLLTVIGALVLWMELIVREAAVYVIVLLLPLAFAAFVWPARRVWAVRSIELLFALILSKFAIVAVLSLGAAALGHSGNDGVTGLLAGAVLLMLAALAPWALLRLIPLAEVASSAATSLRGGALTALGALQRADAWSSEADHWVMMTAQMRAAADPVGNENRAEDQSAPSDEPATSPPSGGSAPPSPATAEADIHSPPVQADKPLDPSWDESPAHLDLENSDPAPPRQPASADRE